MCAATSGPGRRGESVDPKVRRPAIRFGFGEKVNPQACKRLGIFFEPAINPHLLSESCVTNWRKMLTHYRVRSAFPTVCALLSNKI
jgi:hypothetical protein